MNTKLTKEEKLISAEALVQAISSDDHELAEQQLARLNQVREHDLFSKIGHLTRELHEAVQNVNFSAHLNNIPNTYDRLNYVITTSREAVHHTLGSIEYISPLNTAIKAISTDLKNCWQQVKAASPDNKSFLNKIDPEISQHLNQLAENSDQINTHLSELMLAQGFQDITGQVLRQVINLIENIEDNLVQLIRLADQSSAEKLAEVDPVKAEGPQINPSAPNVVNKQDDVDDLLSSLGF